jgi:hypothetical protein
MSVMHQVHGRMTLVYTRPPSLSLVEVLQAGMYVCHVCLCLRVCLSDSKDTGPEPCLRQYLIAGGWSVTLQKFHQSEVRDERKSSDLLLAP